MNDGKLIHCFDSFQVIHDADIYEINHAVCSHKVDILDGPLWAVRLLPWSEGHRDFIKSTSSSGEPPEEPAFEHQCHIVFHSSHAITDGYSGARTLKYLIHFINDYLGGKELDDDIQVAKLLHPSREADLVEKIETMFNEDPQMMKRSENYLRSCYTETLLEKCYPVQPLITPKTLSLFQVFDETLTSQFIAKCKKEKVTVHCAFCTLIEAAIVRVLLTGGIDLDEFQLSSGHCADSRVYYGYSNCDNEFGLGMTMIPKVSKWSKNLFEEFWTNASKFQSEFKNLHSMKFALQSTVLADKINPPAYSLLDPDGQEKPSEKMLYYATTNMRNLNDIFDDKNSDIKLEFLNCLSTIFTYPVAWISSFHTLNGKLSHSLQYSTQVISSTTARKVTDTVYELLVEALR